MSTERTAKVERTTQETSIEVALDLDGGPYSIETPLPFLTHMIEQVAKHGGFSIQLKATGDTEIDGHHTTEDLGITLGQAFAKALGDKRGIRRYGHAVLPMDEARVGVTLDLSGRTFFVWEVPLPKAKIGEFDVELGEVFFEGFCRGAKLNLHVHMERGENLHHILECSFKAFAKALAQACALDPTSDAIPSTKGQLDDEP